MNKIKISLSVAALLLVWLGTWDWTSAVEGAPLSENDQVALAKDLSSKGAGTADSVAGDRYAVVTPPTTETSLWTLDGLILFEGEARAGAEVTLSATVQNTTWNLGSVTSDANGAYHFDLDELRERPSIDLLRMRLLVHAWSAGCNQKTEYLDLKSDAVEAPLYLNQDIVLELGSVVTGRIVDEFGKPIQTQVHLVGQGEPLDFMSDSKGSYRVSFRESGVYSIKADDAVLGRAVRTGVVLELGTDKNLPDLVVVRSPSVRGRVMFADGSPAANISVGCAPCVDGRVLPNQVKPIYSDDLGRYEWSGLAPGLYEVSVRLRNKAIASARVSAGGDSVDLTIDAKLLRWRFVDKHGQHIEPVYMRGSRIEEEGPNVVQGLRSGALSVSNPVPRISGWFEQVLVEPGSVWWIRLAHETLRGEALVEAGPEKNVYEFVIEVGVPKKSARLQVLLPEGGAEELRLSMDQTVFGLPAQWEVVDEDCANDRWTYAVTPGIHDVRIELRTHVFPFVSHFPFEQRLSFVEGKETVVDYRARRCGNASIIVRFADGLPRKEIDGMQMRIDGRPWRHWARATNGGFTSENFPPSDVKLLIGKLLEPGRHQIEVRAEGLPWREASVLVRAGEWVNTEIWLGK